MLLVKIVRSTGEGLLWYGICVPCSKRLPGVRDAFSEAFGVKNRLLRYGRDIRCQKQPSLVRDASSKARRTADSTDCGQPPAHRTHLQCAKQPRSEVSRHKKRVNSKSIKTFSTGSSSKNKRLAKKYWPVSYFDGIVRSPEAAYCLLISS